MLVRNMRNLMAALAFSLLPLALPAAAAAEEAADPSVQEAADISVEEAADPSVQEAEDIPAEEAADPSVQDSSGAQVQVLFYGMDERLCTYDEAEGWKGLAPDVIRKLDEIDENLSFSLNYVDFSQQTKWEIETAAAEGNCDMVAGYITEGTLNSFMLSRPYLGFPPVLVTSNTDPGQAAKTFAQVAGGPVLALADDGVWANVDAYNQSHGQQPLSLTKAEELYLNPLLLRVAQGQDCALVNSIETALRFSASYQNNYGTGLHLIGIPDAGQLGTVNYGFAFAEGREELCSQVNADLERLLADGTVAALCRQYYGADYSAGAAPDGSDPQAQAAAAQEIAAQEAVRLAEAEQKAAQEAAAAEEAENAASDEEGSDQAEGSEDAAVYTDGGTIQLVQQTLNDLGYDCGVADGIAGEQTWQAIAGFKAENGFADTSGEITDELLAALNLL